jgi:exonuclease VII large subunit
MPNEVSRVVDLFNRRSGDHTNPLRSADRKTIRSPGNPLVWLWLVPTQAVSSGAFSFTSAEFPWKSKESEPLRKEREIQERKELKELLDQQEALIRLNSKRKPKDQVTMKESDLLRIKGLQESLKESKPAETMEQRTSRIAGLKAELEKRVAEKYSTQIARIAELKSMLNSMSKVEKTESPKLTNQRKTIAKLIATLEQEVSDGRNNLAKEMRSGS